MIKDLYKEKYVFSIKIEKHNSPSKYVLIYFFYPFMDNSDENDIYFSSILVEMSKRKSTVILESSFFCFWRHAIERFIERMDSSFSETIREAGKVIPLALAFLSDHCRTSYHQSAFCFPANGGLFFGEIGNDQQKTLGIDIENGNMEQFEALRQNVKFLLGDPPQCMTVKTFVGPNELKQTQMNVVQQMQALIEGHQQTLIEFSNAVRFSAGTMRIGFPEIAHAIATEAPNMGLELLQSFFEFGKAKGEFEDIKDWNDYVQLHNLDDLPSKDGVSAAFSSPANEKKFREFIRDYMGLMQTSCMQDVIRHASRHSTHQSATPSPTNT